MDRANFKYRKNVAGILINQEGLVLTCKRFDEHADWQLPQGGIDEDEEEDTAIIRELEEEICLIGAKIIDKTPEFYQYEWPDNLLARGYRGQEQKLFLIEAPTDFIPDLEKAATKEFKEFQWVTRSEFINLTKETFRFLSYSKGLEYFQLKNPHLFKA